jgi:uncharacterized protein YbjT (DUF2867 family)
MKKILITGATGNVGMEIIKNLQSVNNDMQILAGVQNPGRDSVKLKGFDVTLVHFDFENESTFFNAMLDLDVLFILRPPQITNAKKHFEPLIDTATAAGVKHVVFLSVQGADKSRFIPHHKIEKIIIASGIPYTFLRPAYFMQNFTTILKQDLEIRKEVFLPAGKARFALIDLKDLGEVAAKIISDPASYLNRGIDITNQELLDFETMTHLISEAMQQPVKYISPGLPWFFLRKYREGVPAMMILVMIMLHFLPRFQSPPPLSTAVSEILGREPSGFRNFASRACSAPVQDEKVNSLSDHKKSLPAF